MLSMRHLSLFLIASLVLSSCAARFNRKWNQAVADHAAGRTTAVTGPWSGTWTTETNGHTGNLRCIVSPVAGADDLYQFKYNATWAKILKGGYTVDFTVSETPEGHTVTGSEDLGMFGDFTHTGLIKGNSFNATYEAGGDSGGFFMKRP